MKSLITVIVVVWLVVGAVAAGQRGYFTDERDVSCKTFGDTVAKEENLVDDAERRRPMRADHHGHPLLFQLRDAFGERGVAF